MKLKHGIIGLAIVAALGAAITNAWQGNEDIFLLYTILMLMFASEAK